jgi:hypothetical protein
LDGVGDAGTLDDDLVAVSQPGPVRLPDGRGRDWFPLEGCERLLDAASRLAHEIRRQQVGSGGEDLAELDEHAAGVFQDPAGPHRERGAPLRG